jgi:hypothetical protein
MRLSAKSYETIRQNPQGFEPAPPKNALSMIDKNKKKATDDV